MSINIRKTTTYSFIECGNYSTNKVFFKEISIANVNNTLQLNVECNKNYQADKYDWDRLVEHRDHITEISISDK